MKDYKQMFQDYIEDESKNDAEVIELAKKIIDKLQRKSERFMCIADNAICEGQILERMSEDEACSELGCSISELHEINGID